MGVTTPEVERIVDHGKSNKDEMQVYLNEDVVKLLKDKVNVGDVLSLSGALQNKEIRLPHGQTIKALAINVNKINSVYSKSDALTVGDCQNQVTLVGRVVKDLEAKESVNGRTFCVVSLAVHGTGRSDVSFIDVTLWDAKAESVALYAGKGSVISVEGKTVNRKIDFPGIKPINMLGVIGEKVNFIKLKAPRVTKTEEYKMGR